MLHCTAKVWHTWCQPFSARPLESPRELPVPPANLLSEVGWNQRGASPIFVAFLELGEAHPRWVYSGDNNWWKGRFLQGLVSLGEAFQQKMLPCNPRFRKLPVQSSSWRQIWPEIHRLGWCTFVCFPQLRSFVSVCLRWFDSPSKCEEPLKPFYA